MSGILIHVAVNAVLLWIVGQMVSGVEVRNGRAAVVGAIVLGLAQLTLGKLLILVSLPITFLTFGLFLLVINAIVLMTAAAFVDGFEVDGFGSAFWGSLALGAMNLIIGLLMGALGLASSVVFGTLGVILGLI
ncbi:MAG: phage holin family protein [Gemmatimonadota bacterium]|nr:phage holin family protein [Gemmatimonadota bacterium]MDE3004992.1 phage holin family protein [Gemmatimonadota bacterium]MDE3013380.1 phage holin family protein [Gemmatimonadota bacterium]